MQPGSPQNGIARRLRRPTGPRNSCGSQPDPCLPLADYRCTSGGPWTDLRYTSGGPSADLRCTCLPSWKAPTCGLIDTEHALPVICQTVAAHVDECGPALRLSRPLRGPGRPHRMQQPAQGITLRLSQRPETVHHTRDPRPVIIRELILRIVIGSPASRRVLARTAGCPPARLRYAGSTCHQSPGQA